MTFFSKGSQSEGIDLLAQENNAQKANKDFCQFNGEVI